jgi:shikimate dehydrogenase
MEAPITVQSIPSKITGLIGHPIGHSLSPLMHNTAFEMLQMDYTYVAFDVLPQYLTEALQGLVALGIAGVNVTVPHKEAVIPLLDDLSSEARAIGAVNTIVNDGGKLSGHNTDLHGFVETVKPFQEVIEGEEMSVIGAGGAARAVLYGLTTHFRPKLIHLLNRSADRANSLREFFARSFGFRQIEVVDLYMPSAQKVLAQSRLIVNTTPLGMMPGVEESPIREHDALKTGQVLVDLVYNPPETKLIRLAKLSGVKTVSGIEMLLHQGARSFELWTNRKMPLDSVRQTLQAHLSNS